MESAQRIESTADAFDTLAAIQQSGGSEALVYEEGTLVGVLSEADYARAMQIGRGFQTSIAG
jgi:hypothetical protein